MLARVILSHVFDVLPQGEYSIDMKTTDHVVAMMSGGLAYESIVVRIDNVGFPFLDLCAQNGSPRDGCSRWFTCGFR